MTDEEDSKAAATGTPSPDDPRKPDSPTDLKTLSWKYALRGTAREFSRDQCTDR